MGGHVDHHTPAPSRDRAGIDQGGLLKELLECILQQGFDGAYGLVQFTADGKAFPSPLAHRVAGGLGMLEFLGLAVAKALYEGLLLDIELASLFVMALQHRHPALEDLFTLDPELYRSLIQVRHHSRHSRHSGDAATSAAPCRGRSPRCLHAAPSDPEQSGVCRSSGPSSHCLVPLRHRSAGFSTQSPGDRVCGSPPACSVMSAT